MANIVKERINWHCGARRKGAVKNQDMKGYYIRESCKLQQDSQVEDVDLLTTDRTNSEFSVGGNVAIRNVAALQDYGGKSRTISRMGSRKRGARNGRDKPSTETIMEM